MTTGPLYTKLTDADAKALGSINMLARATAIEKGKAYVFNGWGPDIARRVEVKAKPVLVKVTKYPIADSDYERLELAERIARSVAARDGRAWSPSGYDTSFTQRVANRPK